MTYSDAKSKFLEILGSNRSEYNGFKYYSRLFQPSSPSITSLLSSDGGGNSEQDSISIRNISWENIYTNEIRNLICDNGCSIRHEQIDTLEFLFEEANVPEFLFEKLFKITNAHVDWGEGPYRGPTQEIVCTYDIDLEDDQISKLTVEELIIVLSALRTVYWMYDNDVCNYVGKDAEASYEIQSHPCLVCHSLI